MKSPVHVTGTGEIILERSIGVIRDRNGGPHGVPSETTIYYSNEEDKNMPQIVLMYGRHCGECFFGDPEEGLGGTVQCLKQGEKSCVPGRVVYREVLPTQDKLCTADKVYCNHCAIFDKDQQMCNNTGCSMKGDEERECSEFVRGIVSNADKIRNMTDEELATFLVLNSLQREHWDCDKELEWLKQEFKED